MAVISTVYKTLSERAPDIEVMGREPLPLFCGYRFLARPGFTGGPERPQRGATRTHSNRNAWRERFQVRHRARERKSATGMACEQPDCEGTGDRKSRCARKPCEQRHWVQFPIVGARKNPVSSLNPLRVKGPQGRSRFFCTLGPLQAGALRVTPGEHEIPMLPFHPS
jgi:hypothetical protein